MSEVSYVDEIQDMMLGFGDAGRGQLATAQLVERVLLQQLSWLWGAVSNVAAEHGASAPALEHFLFLLRKSPNRIAKVLRYLRRRSAAANALNQFSEDPLGPTKCTKYRRCIDYLELIDPMLDAEKDDNLDVTDFRRLVRADQASRVDDPVRYQEFVKARRVSFGHGRGQTFVKFSEFMSRFDPQRLRNTESVDMMAFFAFEMVGELVDLVMLARRDRDPRLISPGEIREVLRRLQSVQGLPGGLFIRLPSEGRNPPILCF